MKTILGVGVGGMRKSMILAIFCLPFCCCCSTMLEDQKKSPKEIHQTVVFFKTCNNPCNHQTWPLYWFAPESSQRWCNEIYVDHVMEGGRRGEKEGMGLNWTKKWTQGAFTLIVCICEMNLIWTDSMSWCMEWRQNITHKLEWVEKIDSVEGAGWIPPQTNFDITNTWRSTLSSVFFLLLSHLLALSHSLFLSLSLVPSRPVMHMCVCVVLRLSVILSKLKTRPQGLCTAKTWEQHQYDDYANGFQPLLPDKCVDFDETLIKMTCFSHGKTIPVKIAIDILDLSLVWYYMQ